MIKPFLFRVLVKPFKLEEADDVYKSAAKSGIVFADHDDKKRREGAVDRGVVVSIGPTAFKEFGDCPVEVGDEVFFAKYAGKTLLDPYTNESFLELNDEDLLAGIYKDSE